MILLGTKSTKIKLFQGSFVSLPLVECNVKLDGRV